MPKKIRDRNNALFAKGEFGAFVLIDKSRGPTSNDVLRILKRATNIRDMGHAGTLDPFATGLLVVGLSEASKFFPYINNEPKVYEAVLSLGSETNTLDNEGETVRESSVPQFDTELLMATTRDLLGQREQESPAFSAKKIDGERAYDLARAGIAFTPKKSVITIHALECVAASECEIRFKTTCSGGTYVRVLGKEIAHALGTVGHLTALRRVSSGPWSVASATAADAILQPISIRDFLGHLPEMLLDDAQNAKILNGGAIASTQVSGMIRLTHQGVFRGVGEAIDGTIRPRRLIAQ